MFHSVAMVIAMHFLLLANVKIARRRYPRNDLPRCLMGSQNFHQTKGMRNEHVRNMLVRWQIAN